MDRGAAEISVSSRLDADPAAVPPLIGFIFRHSHRRLRRRFGGWLC